MIKVADDKLIIKATTPNSKKYDTKIDVYTSEPKGPHESINSIFILEQKFRHFFKKSIYNVNVLWYILITP